MGVSETLEYQAQSPDEGALVSAARNFGFVFKVSTAIFIPCIQIRRRGWGVGIILSLRLSVHVSDFVRTISPASFNHFFAKFGMVVYHHEAESHEQKLVNYLHCQGHSKGFY